jgi:hypothetical protein
MVTILGIKLFNRTNAAVDFQKILSKHGCSIKTRIGLHAVHDGICSTDGIILIEFIGNIDELKKFEEELKELENVEIQKMIFN